MGEVLDRIDDDTWEVGQLMRWGVWGRRYARLLASGTALGRRRAVACGPPRFSSPSPDSPRMPSSAVSRGRKNARWSRKLRGPTTPPPPRRASRRATTCAPPSGRPTCCAETPRWPRGSARGARPKVLDGSRGPRHPAQRVGCSTARWQPSPRRRAPHSWLAGDLSTAEPRDALPRHDRCSSVASTMLARHLPDLQEGFGAVPAAPGHARLPSRSRLVASPCPTGQLDRWSSHDLEFDYGTR